MTMEQRDSGYRGGVSSRNRSACAFVVLLMLLMLLPLPGVGASPGTDGRQTLVLDRQYGWPALEHGEYDSITVEGLELARMSDAPYLLPVEKVEIALPAGQISDLELSVCTSSSIFLGSLSLQPLYIASSFGRTLYGSNEGRTEHVEQRALVQDTDGNTLYLSLSPLSYDSVSGDTYFVERITVTVSYRLDAAPQLTTFTAAGEDLLIITSSDMEGEFQRLADWKESLGFNVHLVNVSTAVGGGSVTAEALKSYINGQHNISSIEYVLLAGDQTVIPAWYVDITLPIEGGSGPLPSDLYYASFDYSVDWSNDIHPYYDLSIGRLPFTTVSEASNYIDKLIRYESQAIGGHYEQVLFIGQALDEISWGGDGKDSNAVHVPSSYNITTLYERDIAPAPLTQTMVKDALEAGAHIVNDLSHGNYDYLVSLDSAFVSQIDNPLPYIWYSQACQIGGFDQDPNIASTLLADENNAVAMVAHSREGLYLEGDPANGTSNFFDLAYMDRLFDEELLLGDVLRLSKESLVSELSDPFVKWIYTELNLLGDPTLKVGGYDSLPVSHLRIDDDSELQATAALLGWSGDGSVSDPIIIQDYQLRNSEGNECLYVGNTTLCLAIRNNTVSQSVTGQDGIVLFNVSNAELSDNIFHNKDRALLLDQCQDVTVANNSFQDNSVGIQLSACQDCIVQGNQMPAQNSVGIFLDDSDNCTLEDNILSRCQGYGASVTGDGNNVQSNGFYLNNGSGVLTLAGSQAFNDGSNTWNGNFWFLHSGSSYALAGSGADNSPLATDPSTPPVFNTAYLDSLQGMEMGLFTVLNFTASSPYGMESYRLSINEGAYAESGPEVLLQGLGLSEGINNLSMMAFSNAGNAALYNLSIEITAMGVSVDITAPTDIYLDSDRVALRWTGTDADNRSHFMVRVDNGDWLNLSQNLRYTTPSLAQGWHIAEVKAVAWDGTEANDTVTFFIDTVDPQLSISNLAEGQLLTDNQTSINWTVSDVAPSSGISHFTLQIDSSTVIRIDNSAARSYTMPLSEGSHRITLRAYDMAGNYRQVQVNMVVDTDPPLIEFSLPSTHPYYTSPLVVNWSVEDAGSSVTALHIRINGGSWVDVTGESTHTFSGLADGYYEVELRATDRAGHTAYEAEGMVVSQTQALLDFIHPHSSGYSRSPDLFDWEVWDRRGYTYTYSYSLDSADFVSTGYVSQKNLSLGNGNHTMVVRAVCVQTGAVLQRSTSFLTLEEAQPPLWTFPEAGETEFLFDLDLQAGFALAMFVDQELSSITLRDATGSLVAGSTSWTANGSMLFVPDSPLDHPASYTMLVNVVDPAGNSLSYPVAFVTKNISLPGAPGYLAVNYQPSWDGVSLSLSWEAPADDGGYPAEAAPLQYNVYRHTNETDFVLVASVYDTSYTDASVAWNDFYIYYVTAVNPVGEGPASGLGVAALPEEPDLWTKISLLMDNLGEVIDLFLADSGEYLEMVGEMLGGYWDTLVQSVSSFLDSAVTAISDALDSAAQAIIEGLNTLGDAIIASLEALGQALLDAGEAFSQLSSSDLLATIFIIFLLALLYVLITTDRSRKKKENPPEPSRYKVEEKAEVETPALVIPRSINATVMEQNGKLIMEELTELEAAYQDGLVGWQEYEMAKSDLSSRLSAMSLASYFTKVSEDTY